MNKLQILKAEIEKVNDNTAINLNEAKKEITIDIVEDTSYIYRGFRLKREGANVNISELYGNIYEYMKVKIFGEGGLWIGKLEYQGITFETIDSKKHVEIRTNGEHLMYFNKGAKNYAKSLDEAESKFSELIETKYHTNIEDFNKYKAIITAAVEYLLSI